MQPTGGIDEAVIWISGCLWNWRLLPIDADSVTGSAGDCRLIAGRDDEHWLRDCRPGD